MNISSLNNPAINSHGSSNSVLPLANTANSSTQGNPQKIPETGSSASSSPQDKRQTALQIVNRTLTMAYEKISARAQTASAEYEAFEPLTAEKVANNILGFIERRLQMDVAEGATQEELQARLEAGLSGFKKGFAEASEKLEALSLLSPEIQSDIGKTYELVLSGVDELRKKFIPSMESDSAKSTSDQAGGVMTSAAPLKPATQLEVPGFLPAVSNVGYGNYEYGRAREFSFELTTKEGDKVTIKAASSEGLAVEAGRAGRGNNSVSAVNASYSASQSFALTIEGELSEDELGAINDLLGRVNDLAGEFFSGNLDVAFEQAMNLGYDAQQIGNFSLNLAQVEIQQVTQAYQAFEPDRADGAGTRPQLLVDQLLPLGNFIKDLLASLDQASEFSAPKLLLANLAQKMPGEETAVDQQQGKRFRDFMEQLFALDLG